MKIKFLVVLLLASLAVHAADRQFDQIVKAIESHYGVKPTHIPLLGLGNFVLKTAHPQGISGFRIAMFENLDGHEAFNAVMTQIEDSDLHALVQVQSNRNGESTYVFTGNPGKSTRLLLATLENHEATVVEVKVDMDALLHLLRDPDHIGDAIGVHRQDP